MQATGVGVGVGVGTGVGVAVGEEFGVAVGVAVGVGVEIGVGVGVGFVVVPAVVTKTNGLMSELSPIFVHHRILKSRLSFAACRHRNRAGQRNPKDIGICRNLRLSWCRHCK